LNARKVLVIGLDSTPPREIFEMWRDDLPNFRRMMDEGVYGELESSIPAITCPAWMCMMTSRNPGQLGFFGFRNRKGWSYEDMFIANSRYVREDCVWDILSRQGLKVGMVGVPQTYPPKPVNGFMVTSFLTPGIESQYTYPAELKEEIASIVGEYIIDCRNFRTENKKELLDEIYEMTEKRFKVVKKFIAEKPWDFFMMVEMGPDRIQHGFWKYHDRTHFKYEEGNEFENAIFEYYKYLDRELGELLGMVDHDETAIIIVSDHGAKNMDGAINVNDWLIEKGYLVLKEKPEQVTRFAEVEVDWERTTAWGLGGYYSRIFLNVKGREENGVIDPADYERVRDEIKAGLEAIPGPDGQDIGTKAFRPQDIYVGDHVDEAPDLIVYFGDLNWRATGSVGHDSFYSFETEIGPDDAVHAQHGIFMMKAPGVEGGRRLEGLRIYDGAPTILSLFGLPVPAEMEGTSILDKAKGGA
jgi:predicted AlkP superfamily phosphohydrolase/phosphomutase